MVPLRVLRLSLGVVITLPPFFIHVALDLLFDSLSSLKAVMFCALLTVSTESYYNITESFVGFFVTRFDGFWLGLLTVSIESFNDIYVMTTPRESCRTRSGTIQPPKAYYIYETIYA